MTAGADSGINNGALSHIPGRIRPTAHRGWWIFFGLLLQLGGIGGPVFYVWRKAKHQDVVGKLTVATVKLVWHESLHSKTGLEVLIAGAVVFAIGSAVVARPFVKHWVTLLVGVPIAALCGALVLGVAAIIVALIVFMIWADVDPSNLGGGGGGGLGGGGGKKKGAAQQPDLPGFGPADPSQQSGGNPF
jgi:hypothetical protein